MDLTQMLFIFAFVVLIILYVNNCEKFYIEPNTIAGGETVLSSDGDYEYYDAPLELGGPGPGMPDGY